MKLVILFFLLLSCSNQKFKFENVKPESLGWSSEKLDSLAMHLEASGSSAMILMRDGKVIFDWGESSQKRLIHSIRKSMLNSLLGIYIDKAVIDTNASLEDLNIDDIYTLTSNEKQARVIDLLKSRSGVYHSAAAVSEGMLQGKPDRGSYAPGEQYYYNNWDFNVLGHILELKTKKSIYVLFNEHIAKPLGMHDYKGDYISIDGEDSTLVLPNTDGFYQYEKSQSKYPAYHFRLSARDMALYGQLWLNRGKWNGTQILSEDWIDKSTTAYSMTNPYINAGYGYLWNVLIPNKNRKTKSFYHTGTGVHMLGVYPGSKLVVVHRVNTEKEYQFSQQNFYKMISKIWDSEL